MLYDSPAIAPPTGLTLTSNASALPNSLIPPSVTGSPVTFDIRTGSFLSYRMDYDDGAGMTVKNATDLTTRSFHLPGMYAVRVQADDFHGLTYKQAVTTVKVRMSVQWVSRVVCDELWTIGVPGQCVLTVYQGSMMGARTGTNDPELMLVGPAIQTKDPPLSMNIHGVVRAQAYTVQKTGHLIGWEMMVAATGVIKILVGSYEVTKVVPISVNTTGFVYQDCSYFPDWLLQPGDIIGYDEQHSAGKLGWLHCPEWNAVSSSAAAAKEGDVYDSVPTHSVLPKPVISGPDYVGLGSEVMLTVLTPEGSYIYLDANTLSEGNKALLESPVVDIVSSFGCLDFWYHMHGSGMGTLSLLAATPGDESNAKPIWSQSGHQGQDWKKASVTVNTTNPVKLLFSAERGLSWTGNMAIDDIVFTSGMCIGSRTLYTWDLGDGTIHENVTATSFNHTYTSRGTYTINVTAFNPVSSSSSATLLQVQEHVESLNLSAGPLAEKWKPFNFSISPQKGSHYSCLWDFGNGNTLESDDENAKVMLDLRDQMGEREHDLPKSNKFNIAFLNTGLYYITATLWNHVDSKNISHRLVIVEEMVEPRIELDEGTSKIALNQSSNIHFVMFAGPTGDNCNLTWDNGDGNFSTTNRTAIFAKNRY
nr:hypothetical protein BaRGS_006367 [Batillaria attramentaria]